MANSLASNIPAIISIPILGSLSDRIGRRPIIFLPLVYVLCVPGTTLEANDKLRLFRTSIIDLSSTLLVTEFEASLWILVATKFTSGIFGGWGILFVVVHAYLADLVPADNRTAAYMYLEATVISGFVIGPVIGGFLSRWFDSGVIGVIQVSLGIRVIGFSFFLLFIKESRSAASLAEAQKRLTVESMALQSISSSFSIFFEKQSWNRAILLVVIFSIGIHYGAASCFFLWTAFKFKWDAYHHGIYQLTLSASRLAWMSLLSLKWFSRSTRGEVWLLQTSLFVMFGSYVIIGTVAESWIVFAMAGVHGLVILAKPTVLGLLSRSVSPSQQGTLFSGLQVTQQIGLFAASLLFPNIWAVTVGTVYSSTFLFVEAGVIPLECQRARDLILTHSGHASVVSSSILFVCSRAG